MSGANQNSTQNSNLKVFYKINELFSIWGLSSFLLEVDNIYTKRKFKYLYSIINICIYIFIVSELVGFFTQKNLSQKQSNDQVLLGLSHPILVLYNIVTEFHIERIKRLLTKLCISLREIYNDRAVEKQMIKKSKFFSIFICLTVSSTLISYGCDGLIQVIIDGSFTTVITAWPDVTDRSLTANFVRVMSYLIWWIFMFRVTAVLLLVTVTTIALSFQYKNLQTYFYSLNDMFKDNPENELERVKIEKSYEDALKVGIKLHAETLWCTREVEVIYNVVFTGQIIINVSVFCMLMLQMVNSERTLMNTFTIILTASAVLGSTGFVMWNIGDVTVEALLVATAIYSSGWQNCCSKESRRICKLLLASIRQSQKPVIIRSAGTIKISYQSYLSIVKTSYSAFSFLY